jgi:O-antigen/teichoic acid export membrane protein
MEWGRLISIAGSVQILVQALGLISGILIIRFLSTSEFALYTLANSMLATTTVMADSGIGAGILSNGGKVWDSRENLGKVIVTGIDLRRKFALLTLIIALPLLLYLLIRHDASWPMALLIILSLIPAFYTALSDTLYEIPMKLNQDIAALQKNQLQANISRFILLISTLYFLPLTVITMVCTGVTRFWANVKLRKRTLKYADMDQSADPEVKSDIVNMLKRTMPSTIYYCASSQITIWLISIFGNTTDIAQLGALERIAGILGLISVMFSTLIIPRFARLPQISKLLILRFLQILCALFLLSCAICAVFYIFSDQVLFILGPKYRHLNTALILVTIAACIKLMAGVANYLSVARGWAITPALHISVSVFAQVMLICYMDLGLLHNVLILSVINGCVALLLYCGYFFYRGFTSMRLSYE